MFSFVAFTNFILLASYALAAPAVPEATTHVLTKRDAVCGVDFRNLVNYDSCLPKKVAYTLVAPSQIVAKSFTTSAQVPSGMQCDHVIELNFVNSILTDSKLCSLLAPLLKADTTLTRDKLFTSMADHLSGLDNLNFVDQSVNNQKKTVIQRAYKRTTQGKTAIDYAVGNYLTISAVTSSSSSVAKAVDTDVAAIITTANSVYAKLPPGKGGRDPATVLKKNLETAIADYNSSKKSVVTEWANVLKVVPRS